ncbi:hypothetical protein NJ7G_1950 [Natrinema sp. J7-2]|nr:hypothetical protein NJ7G_1950 [Natrinema sp. J7-2]
MILVGTFADSVIGGSPGSSGLCRPAVVSNPFSIDLLILGMLVGILTHISKY